ncbi:MAG: hypothetical protein IPK26_01150 [Planctomycetes bacterium]|nr:hypothetical protein [Planctomycetota bacterium]
MIPAGPAVERGIAIALALAGGGALCWLQARVDWLEQVTQERAQAVQAIEELRRSAGCETTPTGGGAPFPGYVVQWQSTMAGQRLVIRREPGLEPQR